MEPLFPWVGSKKRLVEDIRILWDANKIYRKAIVEAGIRYNHESRRIEESIGFLELERRLVEPFCGSAAITFGLEPTYALLNDLNPWLINFFNYIKEHELTIDLRRMNKEFYYSIRDGFNTAIKYLDITEPNEFLGRCFFTLVMHGYSHMWRVNSNGEHNVPFANRPRSSKVYSIFSFDMPLFHYWEFRNGGYDTLLQYELKPDDFVYCDPPYFNTFSSYTDKEFSADNHKALLELLDDHKGPVVISNSDTPQVIESCLAHGYSVYRFGGVQSLGNTQSQGRVSEILAIKNCIVPDEFVSGT